MTITNEDANRKISGERGQGDDYLRFLRKLNWAERLLLFMAKTDLTILQYCTRSTRMTLTSVGAMVIITGILAFFSSFFALKSCFFRGENGGLFATVAPLLIATIYAAAIMAFDREIVSATDKRAAKWRIPFAIMIGFVIAFPIELQMQKGRIDKELITISQARMVGVNDEIAKLNGEITAVKLDLNQKLIEPLVETRSAYTKSMEAEKASAALEARPENGLCRGNCEEFKKKAAKYQEEINKVNERIAKINNEINLHRDVTSREAQIKQLAANIQKDLDNSYDLLSQAEALSTIHKNSWTAFTLGWFLRIFFICFELFPVLIKLFMPYTEYHAYQDARTRLNVNKIIAYTNLCCERIHQNPGSADLRQTEITDDLAELTEDREIDINDPEKNCGV